MKRRCATDGGDRYGVKAIMLALNKEHSTAKATEGTQAACT